jgi:hypothetical protein
MPNDEQQLVAMLQAIDRQLRAVLVQVEAATELARESLAQLEDGVRQLEAALHAG